MDDLYGDLENYNDVNAIDELRHENEELKFRVEEYATNMAKLQKDYDKLASEYKKLEINYSSLMKTARAEIERKSHIIDNLNAEKDMVVLNSIQNQNKTLSLLRRKIMRDRSCNRNINNKARKDTSEPDIGKGNKKDSQDIKKFDAERDRNEENRVPSIERPSSANTDDSNKMANIDAKLGKLEKATESKENVLKGKRALGLKHRRKSMPAVSKPYGKCSSDEEYEGHSSTEKNPREWPSRDDKRKHIERHKPIHKISETSGIDEKYSSYHESSRETYYKGKTRYRSARDRYEASRNKRTFSPEWNRRPRESPAEYQRPELRRHRVLESPPLEKCDPRRYRDRRSNFEREDSGDRLKPRQDRLSVKKKAESDYDVPSKRQRRESDGFPGEDDARWNQPPIVQEKPIPIPLEHLQQSECQSPDYEAGLVSAQPVKEIRYTAATTLEDPRLTSDRYVRLAEGDRGQIGEAISISGKNVQIVPIKRTNWDIPKVPTPEALKKPPDDVDKLIQKVYANIDDPTNSNSIESGELQSDTTDRPTIDYYTENFLQDYENERHNLKSQGNVTSLQDYGKEACRDERKTKSVSNERLNVPEVSKNVHVETSKNDHVEAENQRQSLIFKYKIPKKKPEPEPLPNPLGILVEQLHSTCGIDKTMKPNENKLDADKMFSTDDEKTHDNKVTVNSKVVVVRSSKSPRQLRSSRKLSAREIVAHDLELSDETTDNMDILKHHKTAKSNKSAQNNDTQKTTKVRHKYTEKDVESKEVQKRSKSEKVSKDERLPKVEEKPPKGKTRKRKPSDSVNNDKEEPVKASEETVKDQSPSDKKDKKTKKKSTKHKEKNKAISEQTEKATEKKTREKKTTNVKEKFTALFGESSSLITPEDLGIPVISPQETAPVKKYVPIFEDAQDAIDVNVNVVCERQTESPPEDSIRINESPVIDETACDNEIAKPEIAIQSLKNDTAEHKDDEVCISVPEGAPNIEVLNAEAAKEPNVVKTVIISTGVQPRLENIDSRNVIENNSHNNNNITTKVSVPLSAIATSTPYKKHLLLETIIDSSCGSSDKSVSRDTSSVDQSSMSNGVDKQNDDAPDARIFIRRRRRLKK